MKTINIVKVTTVILFSTLIIILFINKQSFHQDNPSSIQCEYEGKTYSEGESFDKGDSCNTCTCGEGKVSCGEQNCLKTSGVILDQPILPEGKLYSFIVSFDSPADTLIDSGANDVILYNDSFSMYIYNSSEGSTFPIKDMSIINQAELNNSLNIHRIQIVQDLDIPIPQETMLENFDYKYFYTDTLKLERCTQFQLQNEGCLTNSITLPFTNTSSTSQTLYIYCAVNLEDDVINYCDNILNTITIEKLAN